MRAWRVHPPHGVLKWVLVWMSFCFIVFKVGPPSQWRLKDATTVHSPCPSCEECFCSLPEYPFNPSDCGKHDPAMSEEMHKDPVTMLSEEINLQKIVANESMEHARRLVMDARKSISHYQEEAVKCNLAVETCEEARERAETQLIQERRLTALWENRAREYGWKDTTR
ncbi:hypothetical protein HN51_014639 [Arachis hypogaea]|uniref:Uncharacterized protein n=1 Tax=Arachis hypogaea TaxID=3818 RepID=A0A445CNK9_ARAHY|nr:uncharacterized protein LOC112695493 [Arachis hypogaea]XP_057722850.1 uncharacterized protein LOC130936726 [Arachis stenosperma]QHO45460.1 uncharacterized protein DS421_6g179180 [Arachis hypogaea]RYR52521.1 hypothetical protein Ahy_A06g027429 [Arachis hypogaea]